MPPRRRARAESAEAPRNGLVRTERWAGLGPGDPVEVQGTRGAVWVYMAHVRNERTREEWVEVAGGRHGEHAVRSFAPSRIFPPGRVRGPSLEEAPRLPL